MTSVWSDEGKLRAWLDVELAATAASAELGIVPQKAARALQERTALLRHRRHRARPPDPRGGSAHPRGPRRCARRRRCARGAAPRDAPDGPDTWCPRRADDLRAEARRLGVRAGPEPAADSAGAR